MQSYRVLGVACCVLLASAAHAQRQTVAPVPSNLRPPTGMCRVLLDGVAPGQQPAPTSCESALRNRPANGRVIFGKDFPQAQKTPDNSARRVDPGLKGVVNSPKPADTRPADQKAAEKQTETKKPDDRTPPRRPPGGRRVRGSR
jgi:hypothetical protein